MLEPRNAAVFNAAELMRTFWINIIAVGGMGLSGCTPPIESAGEPPPPMTPHPARAAKETAIKLYPDLAKEGSTFNVAFRELYEERTKNNPASLTELDWPLELARRTGGMLGVHEFRATPIPEATPTPPPAPEVRIIYPTPARTPTALDRGPYGGRELYDKYGNRIR